MANAIRYTRAGGQITVRWHIAPDRAGVFEVQDSGIGIAKEHWPRLTERFYRVDGSRARDTGGTGLGLAIVKHVAQRHGGSILIDSEVGMGSSFKVVLPAVRVRKAAAPGTAPDVLDALVRELSQERERVRKRLTRNIAAEKSIDKG